MSQPCMKEMNVSSSSGHRHHRHHRSPHERRDWGVVRRGIFWIRGHVWLVWIIIPNRGGPAFNNPSSFDHQVIPPGRRRPPSILEWNAFRNQWNGIIQEWMEWFIRGLSSFSIIINIEMTIIITTASPSTTIIITQMWGLKEGGWGQAIYGKMIMRRWGGWGGMRLHVSHKDTRHTSDHHRNVPAPVPVPGGDRGRGRG